MAKKKNETAGEAMRRIVEELSQPDDPKYKLAKDKDEALEKLFRGQGNWTDLVRVAMAANDEEDDEEKKEKEKEYWSVDLLTSHIQEEYSDRFPGLYWVIPNSENIPHVLLAKRSWRPVDPDAKPIKYYSGLLVLLGTGNYKGICEALRDEGYYVFVAGDIYEDENFEKAKEVIKKYLTDYIEPML